MALFLAFDKMEDSTDCVFNLYFFYRHELYLNVRQISILDDTKQCKPEGTLKKSREASYLRDAGNSWRGYFLHDIHFTHSH